MKHLYIFVVAVLTFFSFGLNVFGLKMITINEEKLIPYFNKDTRVYNYYTNKDIIAIEVVKEENEEIKGYGTYNIKDGLNEFIITSTKNNEHIEYKINVFKNYKKENDKTSSLLKNLNILNYNINFNSLIFEYDITINENEDTLIIDYETISEFSKVKIIGNSNLNNKANLIEIIVTSGDNKSKTTYKINVKKTVKVFSEHNSAKEKKENFTELESILTAIIIFSIGILAIFIIFRLFFSKKGTKNKL